MSRKCWASLFIPCTAGDTGQRPKSAIGWAATCATVERPSRLAGTAGRPTLASTAQESVPERSTRPLEQVPSKIRARRISSTPSALSRDSCRPMKSNAWAIPAHEPGGRLVPHTSKRLLPAQPPVCCLRLSWSAADGTRRSICSATQAANCRYDEHRGAFLLGEDLDGTTVAGAAAGAVNPATASRTVVGRRRRHSACRYPARGGVADTPNRRIGDRREATHGALACA
jgi:hypothetical protein